MLITTRAVRRYPWDEDAEHYDVFVDGKWVGSRRTFEQVGLFTRALRGEGPMGHDGFDALDRTISYLLRGDELALVFLRMLAEVQRVLGRKISVDSVKSFYIPTFLEHPEIFPFKEASPEEQEYDKLLEDLQKKGKPMNDINAQMAEAVDMPVVDENDKEVREVFVQDAEVLGVEAVAEAEARTETNKGDSEE